MSFCPLRIQGPVIHGEPSGSRVKPMGHSGSPGIPWATKASEQLQTLAKLRKAGHRGVRGVRMASGAAWLAGGAGVRGCGFGLGWYGTRCKFQPEKELSKMFG